MPQIMERSASAPGDRNPAHLLTPPAPSVVAPEPNTTPETDVVPPKTDVVPPKTDVVPPKTEQAPVPPDIEQALPKPAPPKPAPPVSAPPKPAPSPAAKPAAAGKYQVRVGAFSSEANAKSLAGKLGGHTARSGKYWLVELGPFADAAAAKRARDGAAKRGYGDARVITD